MTDLDKLIQLASADTISDELLAAYIDGNTTAEENAFVESSAPMEDLNDISELVADSQSFEEKLHFYDGDYGFWELGIPPVLDQELDRQFNLNDESADEEKILLSDENIDLSTDDCYSDFLGNSFLIENNFTTDENDNIQDESPSIDNVAGDNFDLA